MVFCKEVALGKISRGERVFNLKLIISYDTESEYGLSMSFKYNGQQYNIRDRASSFFNGSIMLSGEITKEVLNNIYTLCMIFIHSRGNSWDMKQNLAIIAHEVENNFIFQDEYDIKTYLCSIGMYYDNRVHRRFVFPDEGLEFLFNLPGIGDTYDAITNYFGRIEDADYMKAIGTAG